MRDTEPLDNTAEERPTVHFMPLPGVQVKVVEIVHSRLLRRGGRERQGERPLALGRAAPAPSPVFHSLGIGLQRRSLCCQPWRRHGLLGATAIYPVARISERIRQKAGGRKGREGEKIQRMVRETRAC